MQSYGRLQKQEAGHVEQLAKLEQQITQHSKMLQDVRSKLELVKDEVCALRALVAVPSVPTSPAPDPPPLPAPRTAPPPVDLLYIVHVNSEAADDQNMETCGESEDEWRPVRRPTGNWDRRNESGVIKGYTEQKENRMSVPKHIVVEEEGQSCLEIANMLCGMSQENLLEVVNHCRAGMLQRYSQSVLQGYAQPVHTVVQIPTVFCGWRVRNLGREPGQKGSSHTGPRSAKAGGFCVPSPSPFEQVLWQVPMWVMGIVNLIGFFLLELAWPVRLIF